MTRRSKEKVWLYGPHGDPYLGYPPKPDPSDEIDWTRWMHDTEYAERIKKRRG